MDARHTIRELHRNQKVIAALLQNVPSGLIKWKSDPKHWCILEIVRHLIDEEREDFRARVKHTLENPRLPLIPIDPQEWVVARNYLGQDYGASIVEWQQEREKSIKWLSGLDNANWENKLDHPQRGKISALSFLHNWLAHDYLHIRQINGLKYNYLKNISGDPLEYAGNW